MKNHLFVICRHRFLSAIMLGLGVGWAMSEAISLGVGIAIGGGMAIVLMQRAETE